VTAGMCEDANSTNRAIRGDLVELCGWTGEATSVYIGLLAYSVAGSR